MSEQTNSPRRRGAAISASSTRVDPTAPATVLVGAPTASPEARLDAGTAYLVSERPATASPTSNASVAARGYTPKEVEVKKPVATIRQTTAGLVIGSILRGSDTNPYKVTLVERYAGKKVINYRAFSGHNFGDCGWVEEPALDLTTTTTVSSDPKCNVATLRVKNFARFVLCERCKDGIIYPLRGGLLKNPNNLTTQSTKGGRYVLIKGQPKGRAPFGDDQWGYIDSRYLPPKYTSAPGTASDPSCILDPGRTKVPNANNHSNWPKVCTNGSGNKPSADK